MPTKTKPLEDTGLGTVATRIDETRRQKISELLGLSGEALATALADLQHLLAIGTPL